MIIVLYILDSIDLIWIESIETKKNNQSINYQLRNINNNVIIEKKSNLNSMGSNLNTHLGITHLGIVGFSFQNTCFSHLRLKNWIDIIIIGLINWFDLIWLDMQHDDIQFSFYTLGKKERFVSHFEIHKR